MQRLIVMVLLLLLIIPAGWSLLPLSEPDDPLHSRPSAIERTVADVLPRLNLANDWAMKVNLRAMEWQLTESFRECDPLYLKTKLRDREYKRKRLLGQK
jgi:hypothetical protein